MAALSHSDEMRSAMSLAEGSPSAAKRWAVLAGSSSSRHSSCHPYGVLSSILPAVFTGIAFVLALLRLPALHPTQVWTGSWAVASVLYSLRLLPYRDLSWLTAALICGAVVVFAAG